LARVKLIAEPWDCGPGGYQVGGFPPGWAEWNDKFRDTVRKFWLGHAPPAELTGMLCASGEFFNHQGRRPWASINFVTAHDGFTLNDVFSYNEKHNQANGEDNKDGSSHDHSWNCGAEGPTDDPEIIVLRKRQIRNVMATLLLAQGTPMILAGDEFGRTQGGNNNAYCQDNEISWLNWELDEKGKELVAFTRRLTALRHKYPILRRNLFLDGQYNEELGIKDLTWINADGSEMQQEHWSDTNMRCFAMLLDGRAQVSGIRQRGRQATLLIVINDHHDLVHFTLPECSGGNAWLLLIDTNVSDNSEQGSFQCGTAYAVTARSLLVFTLQAETP
jgi:isoamylase